MKKLLFGLVLGALLAFQAGAQTVTPLATGKVTLAWDPVPTDASIVAVQIYYGTSPGVYGPPVIVTPATPSTVVPTTVSISGLLNGVTYYFVATCVANYGAITAESNFSPEISTLIPYPKPLPPSTFKVQSVTPK